MKEVKRLSRLISIIMPVYNAQKYLDRSIKSVITQTYKEIELIIVNDGSTDNSMEICKKYASQDKRIKVYTQENKGVSAARNLGIEMASGEYLMFIDSDDYILENMIQDMKQKISNNNIDLVISGMQMNYIQNKEIVKQEEYKLLDKKYTKAEFINSIIKEIPLICFCGPCCKLYKAELLKSNHIRFSEELTMGEDTWYNLDYIKKCEGNIVTLQNIYYNYMRENENSLFTKYYEEYIRMTENVYNKFLNIMIDEASEEAVKNFKKTYIMNLIYANNINFKYKTNYKKKIRDIEYSLKNKVIQNNIRDIKFVGIKEKVFSLLIKTKMKYMLYMFFKIKNIGG